MIPPLTPFTLRIVKNSIAGAETATTAGARAAVAGGHAMIAGLMAGSAEEAGLVDLGAAAGCAFDGGGGDRGGRFEDGIELLGAVAQVIGQTVFQLLSPIR